MSKKNPKKQHFNSFEGFVYSTNPDYQPAYEEEAENTPDPGEQLLHLHRETKGRGGKAVVIVRGFVGSEEDLQALGKAIKSFCGTGGSVKDGEIIIQGDQRQKVEEYLQKDGYRTKRVGG
jgi:translation initiation factor 1